MIQTKQPPHTQFHLFAAQMPTHLPCFQAKPRLAGDGCGIPSGVDVLSGERHNQRSWEVCATPEPTRPLLRAVRGGSGQHSRTAGWTRTAAAQKHGGTRGSTGGAAQGTRITRVL